jgi:membrane-bound ClpP family serine protease
MITFILLMAGLFLIYLEFFIPGAVMGIAGALLIIASIFMFIMGQSSSLLIVCYLVFVGISIALVIKYALWRIPKGKPENSIYSSAQQQGFQASDFDRTTIGKIGMVLSDLKPGGYILVEGKQHQAISESGYIPQGEQVLILKGEGDSLIVKKTKDTTC